MSKLSSRAIWFATALVVGVGVILCGCEEKDITIVVDEDEVIRYVTETTECLELFSTSGLINSDPYTVPFDNAVYTDSILTIKSSYQAFLVPLKVQKPGTNDTVANSDTALYQDYGNYGKLREALVEVTDEFHVQTTRTYADSTAVDSAWREITRYGFFLKLGDDGHEYLGWLLWGYNGAGSAYNVPPFVVRLEKWDGSEFSGDYSMYQDLPKSSELYIPRIPYVRLIELDTVVVRSRLTVSVERSESAPGSFQLISGVDTSGYFMRNMIANGLVSTAVVRADKKNSRQYNLLCIQSFADDLDYLHDEYMWCVPYVM